MLLGSAMIGAVAAGTQTMTLRDAVDVGARRGATAPAGGAIAALHARKRRAFGMLERAEREIRELDRKLPLA